MTPRTRLAALALAAGLGLAGCSSAVDDESTSQAEPNRTVQTVTDEPAVVDVSAMNVPNSFSGMTVIDPEWTTPAQYASGVYVGAKDAGHALEFTAISATGDVLWSVERPLSCTGFTLAHTSDGRALAVLVDTQSTDEALAQNSATAYDLHTGEVLWGPVDVPGPYQGPGLVFAAPPEDFMGEGGARVALNPDDGSVALDEASGTRILGDFSGTILSIDNDELSARTSTSPEALWSVGLSEHGWEASELRGSVDEMAAQKYGLLSINGGPGPVIDLATGEVLIERAMDLGEDPMSGTLIVLDDAGLHSFDPTNNLLWSQAMVDDTSIATVGGVFVYLRVGDTVRAHNVLTGAVAMAYVDGTPGTILVPAHISPEGAGLLYDENGELIIATVEGMGDGMVGEGPVGEGPAGEGPDTP